MDQAIIILKFATKNKQTIKNTQILEFIQSLPTIEPKIIEFEYNREFPYLQYHIELSLKPYYKMEQLSKYFCKLIKKNQIE